MLLKPAAALRDGKSKNMPLLAANSLAKPGSPGLGLGLTAWVLRG
jgi:hypothetical protein